MQKNKHRLSTFIFLSSFGVDLKVLTELDLSQAQLLFSVYLFFAVIASLANHALAAKVENVKVLQTTRVASYATEFIAQFFVGGLLSGFLIFYTKSGSLYFSWPFIILLAVIFFGNEFLRSYRSHLAFQTLLLFIATCAFLNAALPIWYGTITPQLFLLSVLVSTIALIVYLLLLWMIDRTRLESARTIIALSCAIFSALFILSYLWHVIPPVPLSIKESGMYQSIVHNPTGTYTLVGQTVAHWWDPRIQTFYLGANNELSAYTAVFAPTAFATGIEHQWEWYDPIARVWKTQSTIAFMLNGGRKNGYRGYSTKTHMNPGYWRVVIKTTAGQVIGTIRFIAVAGDVPSNQITQTIR